MKGWKLKEGGCASADSKGTLNEVKEQAVYHKYPREYIRYDLCEEDSEAGGENRFLPQTEALPERPLRAEQKREEK